MSDENKQLSKARQALVDRVLSRLDAGAMPWDNGMRGAAAPFNAISGAHYRGMNMLNLLLSGKSDPRWLTFNQAQDNGYSVKKGAKGVPIELYKIIDRRTGKDADIAAIREEVKDMTFEERQEFKRKNLQSFARSYYVFNASDVHGIEPYVPKALTPTDISARNERIENVISNSQAPIHYDGNGRNYYDRSVDEIHLTDRAAFTSDEFFYNTALHEMAHSTGHSSRLNRNMGDGFGSKSYAREELVAELSSVLTAAELGLNHSDRVIENSAEYVRSWATLIRDDPQTLIDATFDASKATDYICDVERNRAQRQEKTQKESERSSTSALYNRYAALQDKYSDAVIFMRIGDFYEVMGEKAKTVAEEADLTLTGRDVGLPERVPMCGVPHHAMEQYVEKIRGKHSVVIVENEDEEKLMPSYGGKRTPIERQAQKENLQDAKPIVIYTTLSEISDKGRPCYNAYALDSASGEVKYLDGDYSSDLALQAAIDQMSDYNGNDYRRIEPQEFKALSEKLKAESAITRERQRQAAMQDYTKDFADDALLDAADDFARHTPHYGTPEQPKERRHAKPLIVNFYAGPSCGKTTAALELTAALKKAGYNVEYVSEYAKELVLENKLDLLKNQQHVTDMQYKWLDRLRNSVDVIVTDSPVLLGLVYGEMNGISDEYKKQIRSYYDSFDNFNMLITRPKDAAFQTEGRIHDEKQSIELDGIIKSMLDTQGVFYGSYKRDDIAKTVERISTTYNRLYGNKKQESTQKESAPIAPKLSHGLKTNLANIPEQMKALPNWVAFRMSEVFDEKSQKYKLKKMLLSPNQPREVSDSKYLKWAHADDPSTWSTFDKAVAFAKKYKLDGLAFSMSGSGMTCIDLDHHLDASGKPSELAQKFIDAAQGTYVERSVSGRGLHIFYVGSRPKNRQNRNIGLDLETYDSERFMSMTGDLYGNATKEVLPPSPATTKLLQDNLKRIEEHVVLSSNPLGLSDNELLDLIRSKSNARDLRDFEAMWRGEDIYGNHNVTDMRLCGMLAFYSNGDIDQVERCFRASGLYRPPPQKSAGYVHRTAKKACEGRRAEYNPQAYARQMNPNRKTAKPNGKPSGSGKHGGAGR